MDVLLLPGHVDCQQAVRWAAADPFPDGVKVDAYARIVLSYDNIPETFDGIASM